MYTSLDQFKTPKDCYNLIMFFNKLFDIKCILCKFKFPGNSYKARIYKYLKENHFVKLDIVKYLSDAESDDFYDFNDLNFFKKVLYGQESEYSSFTLSDADYNQINILMSYYFATNYSDFESLVNGLFGVLNESINTTFMYSLVSDSRNFKELEEEEYLVECKSTDIKEILESLEMIKYMNEDNSAIIDNISNIEKFFKEIL